MWVHEFFGYSEAGESSTKRFAEEGCTFGTGSFGELLDIGVIRYTVLPGFLPASEALHVTQTHFCTPSHADPGRSYEPENRRSSAKQWRCYDGQRRCTSSTAHDGQRRRTSSTAYDGQWRRTSSTAYDGQWRP